MDPKKIILLSYNDVAKSEDNPFPGKLYNKPTYSKPGVDVNYGCQVDYDLDEVTPETFLAVLQGDKEAVSGKGSGRVLESTSADRVFLSFFDHGAPGLIAFPNKYLYAKDLIKAFKAMNEKKNV